MADSQRVCETPGCGNFCKKLRQTCKGCRVTCEMCRRKVHPEFTFLSFGKVCCPACTPTCETCGMEQWDWVCGNTSCRDFLQ